MRRMAGVLLLAGSAMLLTRLALFGAIGLLLAWAMMFGRVSLGRRIVWCYIFWSSFVMVLYEIAWLAHVSMSVPAVLIAAALLSWVCFFFVRQERQPKHQPLRWRWLGLAAAGAVALYINLPVIAQPSAATVMRFAAKTGDDISHINLIEADRKVGGYLYARSSQSKTLVEDKFVGYPQGWHINGAVFETLFIRLVGSDSVATRLASYLLFKTLWVLVATFMIFELMVAAASAFFGLRQELWLVPAAAVGSGALALFLLVSVYGYGFQNFIASIALVCAGFVLAVSALTSVRAYASTRLSLALLTLAAATTWVLPGALLGLLTIIAVGKSWMVDRRAIAWWEWAPLGAIAALTVVLLYITELSQSLLPGASVASINLGGAVPPMSIVGLVLLTACAGVIAIRIGQHRLWLVTLMGISLCLTLALASYQQLLLGEVRYYAIKLAYLSAVLVAVLGIAGVGRLISGLRIPLVAQAGLFLCSLALLPFVLGLDLRTSAYPLKGSAPIRRETADRLLAAPTTNPDLIITGKNPEETYLATRLWSAVRPYNSPERQAALGLLNSQIGNQ